MHRVFAKKSLGQHFLTDSDLLAKIVRAAGDLSGMHILEIGPGPGGLSRALLDSNAVHVSALEKDSRFFEMLAPLTTYYPGRFTHIEGDALQGNLIDLLPEPRAMVANLPYNIGTKILTNLLSDIALKGAQSWSRICVMLQYEVAQRFVAPLHASSYGRLSVLTQWLCHAEIVMHVPPSAFTPPPRVESAMLLLTPRDTPLAPASLPMLERVVAAAFNQRRKMLRSSLKSLGLPLDDLFAETGIDGSLRAQALGVVEFCALARYLELHSTSINPCK
jgi:16S rRNA (adenine1518-N6/adenine1519-N6)-dimethyltransferase